MTYKSINFLRVRKLKGVKFAQFLSNMNPIWITSKAIKCWKLGLFSFFAPAYFINPVNPSINYNRIAAFLSGRCRSRPKGRVQASFLFRNTVCGSGWDQFMQKAPSLGFAPHPCCQPPARHWAELMAGVHLGLFPFPQFLHLSNLWMSTRMKQRMLIIAMLYQGNKFLLRAGSLICHIVFCQAVASWTCWPTHPTVFILLGMAPCHVRVLPLIATAFWWWAGRICSFSVPFPRGI